MDNFYEQLVRTKKTGLYQFVNGATYVVGVFGLLMFGAAQLIPAVLFVAIAVGLFFLKRNFYVEYEYDFTNGEIDFDKIVEMRSRKRVLTIDVKHIELLAPSDSDAVKDFSGKPEKVLKLYPSTSEAKQYTAIVTGGTERTQIIFVPDEKFIELCYKYNPRAVKKFL
ncbi:DUF6106 family protein [Clostridium oryzae]|uniref:Uncharacterized protein n=1 Tax=Clostridium oryzae TaxID=1450648 RepID=A0A1V4IKU8_9CLOT|nr:DUF6106 family protein [Clostridium oryzae]OPJ60107.1 hypothetical protein CLORY_29700 [Clostridium oryzae]